MKHKILLASLALIVALVASARMSDTEVFNYIQTGMAAGKSEQQIGQELVLRGVTPEQVERIQSQYQKSSGKSQTDYNSQIDQTRGRRQSGDYASARGVSRQKQPDRAQNGPTLMEQPQYPGQNVPDGGATTILAAPDEMPAQDRRTIYGHNVFNEGNLTFAPGENLATPKNYTLGPGDEVIIDIWGENEEHIRQTISPEGSIMVAQLGPIYLSGNTIDAANKIIRDRFARKYGGVADSRSDIALSLGNVRSIQVDVMGEVASPGSFQLSPFSTVFHALYNAGGINDIGSLRNIEVLRNGRKIAGVDIYDYLFKGKQTGNIRLQEGDVIIVPAYTQLVNVDGDVKRPMYYEVKPGETLANVLDYAGGFTGDAYSDLVRVSRRNGRENELVNIERGQFNTYRLQDGDVVSVGTVLDRYNNRVELRGAVTRPGMYAIGSDVFTVRDLLRKAEGTLQDAYTGRVMLYREGPDLSLQVEALDLGAIMNGTAPDVELRRNDMLVVSSVHELYDSGLLTIQGEVARPGQYPFASGSTVEDLIVRAGGLLPGASTARVDVARRISDPEATEPTDQMSTTYTLSIDKGLMAGEGSEFLLQPFDVVTIRRSPGYQTQEFVNISGEVAFTGPYVLTNRNERLTHVVGRAGGITSHAYIRGASLERRRTPEEIQAQREMLEQARASVNDTIMTQNVEIIVSEYYNVAIDLEKALKQPGGQYDIVLQDGDRINIPQLTTTVTIAGEVMNPNTVTFEKGKRVKDYINMSGGYTDRANKGKVYVVYMNGNIAKAGRRTKLEPGAQIIVPQKAAKTGRSVLSEVMGYISSFTSLGVMAASIASLLRK